MTITTTIPRKQAKASIIAYWVITLLITFELVYGALWDFNLINMGYVRGVLIHLGYPLYLAPILGVCKLAAALIILLPGLHLLKEWAYAGLVILFGGAVASHISAGDGFSVWAFAMVFCTLSLASWALRPEIRRLS